MRKVATFTGKRKGEVAPVEESSSGLGCSAHDCPLTGTMSDSPGGGNWKCWAHDRLEEASQWPYLTRGIHEHRWLFNLADRIATMPPYNLEQKQPEITTYLKSRDRADLCRMKNEGEWSERCAMEPRANWAIRLRNAAYSAAMDYVKANWSRAA